MPTLAKVILGSPVRGICTPGSAWGDESKRPCLLGEAWARKRLRPQGSARATATKPRPYQPFRSLGGRLAYEVCARRRGGRSLRGRHRFRFPTSGGSRPFSREVSGTAGEVWVGTASR